MSKTPAKIAAAYWTHPHRGCVLLTEDYADPGAWSGGKGGDLNPTEPLPPLVLHSEELHMRNLRREHPLEFGKLAGYYRRGDAIVFCVDPARYAYLDFARDGLRVLGDFNGWQWGKEWVLHSRHTGKGSLVWELALSLGQLRELVDGRESLTFKFQTNNGDWLRPCFEAPNRIYDADGNCNSLLDFNRTGAHIFLFDVKGGRTFVGKHAIGWEEQGYTETVTPVPGLGFFHLRSELPLGANVVHEKDAEGSACLAVDSTLAPAAAPAATPAAAATPPAASPQAAEPPEQARTVFRLFAPRASAVTLELKRTLESSRLPVRVPMRLAADAVTWEAQLCGNLHGVYYDYRVEGEEGLLNSFNPEVPVLDPYALATVSERGPAIVVDRAQLPRFGGQTQPHQPPRYEDVTLVECHLRDLLANAPIELAAQERLGFAGLTRWLREDPQCYLRALGTNTVELQPIQQFDSDNAAAYHWGYMTNNFFSPCAWYARAPHLATGEGSAIDDFAELVRELHDQNLSVVLDVVYNHVGEPAFLALIDKYYYFDVDPHSGEFRNDSGTGNTLRAEAAMSRHLICESLRHLIETFDIDGMRFDLAELIGIDVLFELETQLRKVKPSLIFIAEPWSFRGNMGHELHHSSYAFWNDGFREFVTDYVRALANADGLHYFMKGSIDHAALWPSQSVNYIASHDDMCWPDKITENPGHNATDPTATDRIRTHLAAALTFCANGIPMWPQGLDFLHSKQGVNNTYLRGDLNALDYERAKRFSQSVAYVRGWIAFRNSDWGEILRLKASPSAEYLYRFNASQGSACALLFNADGALGSRRLLLAINPHADAATILLPPDIDVRYWIQFADHQHFYAEGLGTGAMHDGAGNALYFGNQADAEGQPAQVEQVAGQGVQGAPAPHKGATGAQTQEICEGAASCYPPRVWTFVTTPEQDAPVALVLPPLSCCLFGDEGRG